MSAVAAPLEARSAAWTYRRLAVALLTVLVVGVSCRSDPTQARRRAEQEAAAVSAPASRALLFKSGQAYLERETDLEGKQESVTVRLPDGIHGTIWVGATGHRVLRATASTREELEQAAVTDFAGTLASAVGREVLLDVAAGQEVERVKGVLVRLLEADASAPERSPALGLAGQALVLRQSDGARVLPLTRIVGIQIQDADAPDEVERTVRRNVLQVSLQPGARKASDSTFILSSMTHGLSWAPSYELELDQGDEARLKGKAVVINDLEDLQDTAVQLVVGYPNIEFAGVQSPLLPQVTLDQLQGMLRRGVPQLPSTMSQVAVRLESAAPPRVLDSPTLSGERSEDLYLYDAGELTLAKGERAYIPLVSRKVKIEHRYDWELADFVDQYGVFREANADQVPPVWHVVRLTNDGREPWTTAPVIVTGAAGPVAQSEMRYTPVGEVAKVRLTQALDVVGEAVEVRADGQEAPREPVRLYGRTYERIRIRGELALVNRRDRVAPMHLVKHFSGELQTADHNPTVTVTTRALGKINASRTLTWSFELDPGARWTANYQYDVLIRR